MELLFIVFSIAVVIFVVSSCRSIAKLKMEIKISNQQLEIYQNFVKKTPVKKILKIIDAADPKVFDLEMALMLKEYFKKVFLLLDPKNLLLLISDLKENKQADFLIQSLIGALEFGNGPSLLVDSWFITIKDSNLAAEQIFKDLEHKLSPETKKLVISRMINLLEYYINVELPDMVVSEYRQDIEKKLAQLKILAV